MEAHTESTGQQLTPVPSWGPARYCLVRRLRWLPSRAIWVIATRVVHECMPAPCERRKASYERMRDKDVLCRRLIGRHNESVTGLSLPPHNIPPRRQTTNVDRTL